MTTWLLVSIYDVRTMNLYHSMLKWCLHYHSSHFRFHFPAHFQFNVADVMVGPSLLLFSNAWCILLDRFVYSSGALGVFFCNNNKIGWFHNNNKLWWSRKQQSWKWWCITKQNSLQKNTPSVPEEYTNRSRRIHQAFENRNKEGPNVTLATLNWKWAGKWQGKWKEW